MACEDPGCDDPDAQGESEHGVHPQVESWCGQPGPLGRVVAGQVGDQHDGAVSCRDPAGAVALDQLQILQGGGSLAEDLYEFAGCAAGARRKARPSSSSSWQAS